MRRSIGAGLVLAVIHSMGATAEPVVLSNGDVLDAVSVERSDEGWILEHSVLGTLLLEADRVARVGPIPTSVAAGSAAPSPSEVDAGVFGTGWLAGFDRSLSLGLSGARGNSENLDGAVGLDLDFEDERSRWNFDGRFYYAESRGANTKNQGYLDLTRDWLVPNQRHFYFAVLRWDADEFQDWDHRGSLGGGIGWNLVTHQNFALRARTGAALTRTFGGVDEETDYEILLRLEADWHPAEQQTITAYSTLYPSLKDTGEFRNLTGIEWKIDLPESDGLSLRLGLENEYESDVPADTDRNDLQYNASLVVDF